ncbi:MAG TPA: hypothetical protein VG826_35495 [Pirellulales bacterium]|nr:hypothetical protein [Pirellulales bacterium]
MSEPSHRLDVAKELAKGVTIHTRLQQEVIATTADKMRLCLQRTLANATARGQWVAPAGIGITILATLVATDFKDALGLSKNSWNTAFILALGAVGLWLARTASESFCAWKKPSKTGDRIEDIVEDMKAATPLILEGQTEDGHTGGT